MILDSGSVKLRCAVGFGVNGSRPSRGARGFLPCASSSARRAVSASRASASNACLASRIVARRCSRRCSSSGSSSPRRSAPKRSSSSASTRSASASSASTFARSAAISPSSCGLLGDHPLVAHRLVARGVRAQLGAIDRQRPQPDQLGLLAQPQRLHEQLRQRLQMPRRGTWRSSGSPGADRRTASAPPHRGRSPRSSLRDDITPFA